MDGEHIGEQPVERFEAIIRQALRRKPAQEAKLSGALRVLAPHSPRLGDLLGRTVETLVKRASFDRPLYAGSVRALSELYRDLAATDLERALGTEDAGGLATLSACCVPSPALSDSLARVAG